VDRPRRRLTRRPAPARPDPVDLPSTWRTRAAELERYAPAAAEAFRVAAAELEEDRRKAADEELTLGEAARESGYSERRLRELIAEKKLPNVGRKHAPRLRRADVPRRATKGGGGWDPAGHVHDILEGTL
jgi:hypothetical protein